MNIVNGWKSEIESLLNSLHNQVFAFLGVVSERANSASLQRKPERMHCSDHFYSFEQA